MCIVDCLWAESSVIVDTACENQNVGLNNHLDNEVEFERLGNAACGFYQFGHRLRRSSSKEENRRTTAAKTVPGRRWSRHRCERRSGVFELKYFDLERPSPEASGVPYRHEVGKSLHIPGRPRVEKSLGRTCWAGYGIQTALKTMRRVSRAHSRRSHS